jgi:hypothetical protein
MRTMQTSQPRSEFPQALADAKRVAEAAARVAAMLGRPKVAA